MKNHIYGYARISTMKQSIQRQIDNIKAVYPDAVIITEEYTGTKMNRPKWNKLYKNLKQGDTVVFDEVSRMARCAEEGFKTYKELYDRGINLVFLKESMLNTETFRETQQIATIGNEIADVYIEATNKVLMILAEKQIKKAFETAQHEVDFLHKRTSEGVRMAQKRYEMETVLGLEHKKNLPGRAKDFKYETKKAKEMKARIMELSKDFNGQNSDAEVMAITKLARNTYYKYKAQLKAEG